mmetsp:Transcript_76973/g.249386  ORF Transcript_76973/g.249386 Transcript_76973/m.249386 type:complete len:125 (+) Transcript_76973:687-1061(+)
MAVNIRDVRYSQGSIGRRFRNGRPLASLVEDLVSGGVHPMEDNFLILDAAWLRGRRSGEPAYRSFDNRRLHCLKRCYELYKWPEQVRLRVYTLPKIVQKMLRNSSSDNNGQQVSIRGGGRSRDE